MRMRRTFAATCLAATLLAASGASAATTVSFAAPETYTDGNLGWSAVDQRLTLEGLKRVFHGLASQYLPRDAVLEVTVLNLDLAGRINPVRSGAGELRIMRGDTWPSMKLRYVLRRNGRIIARGEDSLRAMNYLTRPSARSSEPLRFEKTMLADWFRTRLAPAIG